MELQIVSDIHLEFYKAYPKIKKYADVLVLCGDIGMIGSVTFKPFLKYVSDTWEHVIYVPGNHEYYNDTLKINELKIRYKDLMKKYDNIHYLDDDVWEYEGYRFIGSTLWSNPTLIQGRCDFTEIKEGSEDHLFELTLYTFQGMHKKAKDFITKSIDMKHKKNIVITHFPPIREGTSHPKYLKSGYSDYFTNDLKEMKISTKNVPLWISGHTHFSYDITLKDTRFVSNQMGYIGEDSDTGFKTDLVVKV